MERLYEKASLPLQSFGILIVITVAYPLILTRTLPNRQSARDQGETSMG